MLAVMIGAAMSAPFTPQAANVTVDRYACVAQRLVVQGKEGERYASTLNPKTDRRTFSITITPIPKRDRQTCKEAHKDEGPYMQAWYCDTSLELAFSTRKHDLLRGDTPANFRGLLYSSFWLSETLAYTYRYWDTDEAIRQMGFYWEEGRCQKLDSPESG